MVVDESEEKDGKIYIHEGRYPMVMKSIHGLSHPFPSQPFDNDKERHADLSHLPCTDAVDWLHKAASYFLKRKQCPSFSPHPFDTIFNSYSSCVIHQGYHGAEKKSKARNYNDRVLGQER
jgi:hypothetical protein